MELDHKDKALLELDSRIKSPSFLRGEEKEEAKIGYLFFRPPSPLLIFSPSAEELVAQELNFFRSQTLADDESCSRESIDLIY